MDEERRSMESRVSRLEQQVETHEGDIRRLLPMSVQVGQMEVRLEQMKHGLDQAISELKDFRRQQDEREEAREQLEETRRQQEIERVRDDRRQRRNQMWAIVGTVLTTGMLIVASLGLLLPS